MRVDERADENISAEGLRIAVVTAMFNGSITAGLRTGALEYLEEAGADEVLAVDVPGTFELPLFAQKLAASGYHAVVCLGAVIKGDTDHYEHVAHRASEGLMRVQLDSGVPVAFGILTVLDKEAALARSQPDKGNKGRETARAAVLAALALRELPARTDANHGW